jgi:hypothetical protein
MPDVGGMNGDNASDGVARKQFVDLRDALLKLHKALIDSERIGYEQTFGPITSPANFLRLLTQDPWFAWLRPLSGFITMMDETLDAEEPITDRQVDEFSKNARTLLIVEESGEGFGRQYFEALQRDPDVVLAHSAVVKLKPSRA